MCPKYDLPYTEEDVMEQFCKNGMYLDDLEDQLEIVENGVFNDGDVVNDTKLKDQTPILKNSEVCKKRKENFMDHRDVISYLTTSILLDGNGIIKDIPVDLLLDCIINGTFNFDASSTKSIHTESPDEIFIASATELRKERLSKSKGVEIKSRPNS